MHSEYFPEETKGGSVSHESTDRMIRRSGVLCVHIQKRMYPHQSEQTSKLVLGGSIARSRGSIYIPGSVLPPRAHAHAHAIYTYYRGEQLFAFPMLIRRRRRCGRKRRDAFSLRPFLATATIAENQRCTCAKSRLRPRPHMCNKPHSIMQTFAMVNANT